MQEQTTTEPSNEGLCQMIVEEIAEREDCDPLELSPPLYSAVDPNAADALFDSLDASRSTGHIEFTYLGYEITVHSDHTIDVSEA